MKTKIAIIGCGNWGSNLVKTFCHILGAENVVCWDQDPGQVRKMEQQFPGVDRAENLDQIMADESITGIAVATPSSQHYRIARAGLQSQKHVFVEKPLALTSEDGAELCELAEQYHRTLFVDHLLIFHPAVVRLRELIQQGVLGKVHYHFTQRMNLGIVRTEENALWSLAPHDIALAIDMFGASPSRVVAHGGSFLQKESGIEDCVFLAMEFPGGEVSHIHVSWFHPEKVRKMTVVGSRKIAVFDDTVEEAKLRLYHDSVTVPVSGQPVIDRQGSEPVAITAVEPLEAAVRAFLESDKSTEYKRSDGRVGLSVVRVLAAAERSLEHEGAMVPL